MYIATKGIVNRKIFSIVLFSITFKNQFFQINRLIFLQDFFSKQKALKNEVLN